MATFDQIKQVRISINDPAGFIDFLSVDDLADLPLSPESPQVKTAYRVVNAGGAYVATNKLLPTVLEDYKAVTIRVSDATIAYNIDNYSPLEAQLISIDFIISRLGSEMLISRNQGGSNLIEFTSLTDMLRYYEHLKANIIDQSKRAGKQFGLFGHSKTPKIAGQNL